MLILRDPGSILGWGTSPGQRNGNPLQYSRLENPKDRGRLYSARGRKEPDKTERLSITHTHTHAHAHARAHTHTHTHKHTHPHTHEN